jgi:hypothetical protein
MLVAAFLNTTFKLMKKFRDAIISSLSRVWAWLRNPDVEDISDSGSSGLP